MKVLLKQDLIIFNDKTLPFLIVIFIFLM